MAETRPAFLFYTKDWAASTRALSAEVRGAYINLLAYAWDNDGLPIDDEDRRLIAGVEKSAWRRVWEKLSPKWTTRDGALVNAKQEDVRRESETFTLDMRSLGRAGGRASAKARERKFGSAAPKRVHEAGSRSGSHEQPPKRVHEPVHEAGSHERTKPASASSSAITACSLRSHADACVAPASAPDEQAWGPSPALRRRPHAAFESAIGVDVPQFVHAEFASKLTNAGIGDPGAALMAWYAEVEAQYRGVEIGEDAPDFWRTRFREWRGRTPRQETRAAPPEPNLSWATEVFADEITAAKQGAS